MTNGGEANRQMVDHALRRRVWLMAIVIVVIFGAVVPYFRGRAVPEWPWLTGAVLCLWGWLHPRSLRGPVALMERIGKGLARLQSRIILAVMFFGLILPLGVAMRIFGRDVLLRRFRENTDSYLISSQPRPRDHMQRPY